MVPRGSGGEKMPRWPCRARGDMPSTSSDKGAGSRDGAQDMRTVLGQSRFCSGPSRSRGTFTGAEFSPATSPPC